MKLLPSILKNQRGFSLIEMTAAVGVIAALGFVVLQYTTASASASKSMQITATQAVLQSLRNAICYKAKDIDSDGHMEVLKEAAGNTIPASLSVNTNDSWKNPIRYCTWDPGLANGVNATYTQNNVAPPKAGMVAKLISSGADGTFQTACADVNSSGEDIVLEVYENDILYGANGANGWFSNYTTINQSNPSARVVMGRPQTGRTPTAGFDLTNKAYVDQFAAGGGGNFIKASSDSPAFIKTGSGTLSIKGGTQTVVNGGLVSFAVNTAVVMPALAGGTDYAIYACSDGTCRADSSFTSPSGYTTSTSRLIGGFHYGLVPPGTTVAGGSFATSGNGMIWTQADVDKIAGINQYSIWDLKWRSISNDSLLRGQKGFAYVPEARVWMAIYFISTDTDTNGLSKAGSNIASGTVVPKIPLAFGGNGVATYGAPTWWAFNEILGTYGARMVREREFVIGAFGVTENQSIDAVGATYPSTLRNAGYTSKYGIEQATGHHWIWGDDSSTRWDGGATPWNWRDVNGGRGQVYLYGDANLVRVLLGGNRTGEVASGSRASVWHVYPWYFYWGFGGRAVCDHLVLL